MVAFRTSAKIVTLRHSIRRGLAGGTEAYYSGGWKTFGATDSNGTVKKAALSAVLTFAAKASEKNLKEAQNSGTNPVITFAVAAGTRTPTVTPAPSPTPTAVPTAVPTATPTKTPSSAVSVTPTNTPSSAATATTTASSSATATSTPASSSAAASSTSASGKILVKKRVFDPKKGDWKPATPAKSWSFQTTNESGVVATFNDTDLTTVSGTTITVSEVPKPGYEIFSFIKSETGGSACPDTPTAGSPTVKLTAADFAAPGNGTVQLCAYNKPSAPATAKVTLSFVEAKNGVTTWRLQPDSAADLNVWDESADGCSEFNGAACGEIGKGNFGRFTSGQTGQYFLVTQSYTLVGESCSVTHTAQYSLPETPGERQTLTGTYHCSGAPTLGTWWMLFAFVGAVGAAWYVRRERA